MPNPSPFATNAFDVTVQPLEQGAPGAPTTKTYHGMSIVVDGNIVGRIQSWQPNAYTREGNHVRELSHVTWGRPIDYVPGQATGYTVSFTRVEVWNQELELTLGFGSVFDDLMDQTRPWVCQEYLFRGNELNKLWQYSGCWFQTKNNNNWESGGDAIITVECELAYVSRVRVAG